MVKNGRVVCSIINWFMLFQEGSDSGQESNDGTGTSRKPPKRGRGKVRPNSSKELDGHCPDLSQSPLAASSYGCLSLLKKKRSGGTFSLSLSLSCIHRHRCITL